MADFEIAAGGQLDFKFKWADWLQAGELLSVKNVQAETGLTKISDDFVDGNTNVEVWIQAGTTPGVFCVSCEIETDNTPTARKETKHFDIEVLGVCASA